MEKLIINLLDNIGIVFLVVMILCFIIPMILTSVKRKIKREILDRKNKKRFPKLPIIIGGDALYLGRPFL